MTDPAFHTACTDPLPELARQGVEKFNAGDYFEQHERFEELWRQTDAPIRNLYQGILQVGVAYYQITRNNKRGAQKMLRRSAKWLANLPDVCQGIDIAALRQDSARVYAALESIAGEDLSAFDRALLQPVKWG